MKKILMISLVAALATVQINQVNAIGSKGIAFSNSNKNSGTSWKKVAMYTTVAAGVAATAYLAYLYATGAVNLFESNGLVNVTNSTGTGYFDTTCQTGLFDKNGTSITGTLNGTSCISKNDIDCGYTNQDGEVVDGYVVHSSQFNGTNLVGYVAKCVVNAGQSCVSKIIDIVGQPINGTLNEDGFCIAPDKAECLTEDGKVGIVESGICKIIGWLW